MSRGARPRPAGARPHPEAARPRAAGDDRRPPDLRAPAPAGSEITLGLRAGLALLARRPGDVRRVLYTSGARREVVPALDACAPEVDAREAPESELERETGSKQHEGLAVFARPRAFTAPKELTRILVERRGLAVAFDRVRNPHNVGAILRSAAFFGLDAALFGPLAQEPGLGAAAVRGAEGGAEHLLLGRTTDLADTLRRMRAAGIAVIGADSHGGVNAFGYAFPRPAVLVLGNERGGPSASVRDVFDVVVAIPGAGAVDSLNVSVAASILCAELVRPR